MTQFTRRAGDNVEQPEYGAKVAGRNNALAELVAEVGRDVVVDGQLHSEAVAVAEPQDPRTVVSTHRIQTVSTIVGVSQTAVLELCLELATTHSPDDTVASANG